MRQYISRYYSCICHRVTGWPWISHVNPLGLPLSQKSGILMKHFVLLLYNSHCAGCFKRAWLPCNPKYIQKRSEEVTKSPEVYINSSYQYKYRFMGILILCVISLIFKVGSGIKTGIFSWNIKTETHCVLWISLSNVKTFPNWWAKVNPVRGDTKVQREFYTYSQ